MMYTVVHKGDIHDLEKEVGRMLLVGWSPQGGICVYRTKMNNTWFYQAMIKPAA